MVKLDPADILADLIQPIETAPRHLDALGDPIPVLVYDPGEGGWLSAVWLKATRRNGVWFRQGWRAMNDYDLELRPTHWMPLPPEPSRAGR